MNNQKAMCFFRKIVCDKFEIEVIILDVEMYANIKKYCDAFSIPVALLDGELVCLYCNREGFIDRGEKIAPYFLTMNEKPLSKSTKAKVIIRNSIYCARITVFCGEYYICEFLDFREILSLAEYSDAYNVLFTSVNAMCGNVSSLWSGSYSLANYLREKGDFDAVEKVLEFDKLINSMSSMVFNVSEYIEIAFSGENMEIIEVYRLIKAMIDRCNSILRKCDRAIDFVADIDNYYIISSQQHVIVALINAVQNALLYSPKDYIPIVTLSSVFEKDTSYLILKVVNDSILFVDEKNGEKVDKNFTSQHFGLGIPIIRKFAEKSKGFFSIEEHNGKVVVEVKIPQYIQTNEDILYIESPGYSFYKTDVPDLIEVKMNEIINFFEKK